MAKSKPKSVPKSEPIVPVWGVSEFERSKFIVQLRCEIAHDHAKAYRNAASSHLTNMLRHEQREMLTVIAEGYELQWRLLQSTLDLANKTTVI